MSTRPTPVQPYVAITGTQLAVECLDGQPRRYLNLDPAASTPALQRVTDAVNEFLPWYSSVHRGAGTKSLISTAAFEGAREAVAEFIGATDDHEVILGGTTTHATNTLAACIGPGERILSSPVEHHANMLPWRSHTVDLLPFTSTPGELVEVVAKMMARTRYSLLAVTGASNVTGEVWPIARLAEIAHEHGAEIFVDAAQLAPHRPVSMRELGIDHLSLSAHKLYAPFGSGALVSLRRRLENSEPWLRGGGAVTFVTPHDVTWAGLPDRFEAGSPNVVGAVALGVACDALREMGMDHVAEHEMDLAERLRRGLAAVPGLTQYTVWPEGSCDRVGVCTFNLEGYPDRLLAQILASEHAIGVRNGCFCAHPLVTRLLDIDEETARCIRDEVVAGDQTRMPGAVRASLGLANGPEDVERLVAAVSSIAEHGPAGHYVYDRSANEYRPTDDQRSWPRLSIRLASLPLMPGCGAT